MQGALDRWQFLSSLTFNPSCSFGNPGDVDQSLFLLAKAENLVMLFFSLKRLNFKAGSVL